MEREIDLDLITTKFNNRVLSNRLSKRTNKINTLQGKYKDNREE